MNNNEILESIKKAYFQYNIKSYSLDTDNLYSLKLSLEEATN